MRGRDMVNSLEYRLEDEGHANFSATQKIQALNDAQRQVIAMCTNEALVHLQTSRAMGSATADTDLGSLLYFALPTSSAIITDVTATAADPTVYTKTSPGLVDADIVKQYDTQDAGDRSQLWNSFVDKRLKHLMEVIDEF